jgi:hypothetical protein
MSLIMLGTIKAKVIVPCDAYLRQMGLVDLARGVSA